MIDGGSKDWSAQMRVLDDHLTRAGPYSSDNIFTIADIPVDLGSTAGLRSTSRSPNSKPFRRATTRLPSAPHSARTDATDCREGRALREHYPTIAVFLAQFLRGPSKETKGYDVGTYATSGYDAG